MDLSCLNNLVIETLYSARIFGVIACTTTAIPITLLNALVLIAVWKTPALHKPSQILLANLALTDLLVGVFACPYLVYLHLAIINKWYTSFCFLSKIFVVLTYILAGVSLYTLAIISIDRFLAVKLKFTYGTFVTNQHLIIALLFGWLVGGTLYIVAIIILETIVNNAVLIFFAVYIAVILCTITIFYLMAFYHLKKVSSQVFTSDTNDHAPNATPVFDVNKYRRSLHTMVIVLLAIFIFFLPYCCLSALRSTHESEIAKNLGILTGLLSVFNSCANPILYLWRMKDLRQAVKTTVKGFLRLQT